jgi:hypothetical protein
VVGARITSRSPDVDFSGQLVQPTPQESMTGISFTNGQHQQSFFGRKRLAMRGTNQASSQLTAPEPVYHSHTPPCSIASRVRSTVCGQCDLPCDYCYVHENGRPISAPFPFPPISFPTWRRTTSGVVETGAHVRSESSIHRLICGVARQTNADAARSRAGRYGVPGCVRQREIGRGQVPGIAGDRIAVAVSPA